MREKIYTIKIASSDNCVIREEERHAVFLLRSVLRYRDKRIRTVVSLWRVRAICATMSVTMNVERRWEQCETWKV